MADIQAFHGLRYDLSQVGSLGDVVAPPYDVIDSDFQDKLYRLHEHNVVRLILNRGDDRRPNESIYDLAKHAFKTWRRDGILRRDNQACIYVYHQTFEDAGRTYCRRGFMSRVRIEPFGEGTIYPHEETHSKAKEDRFNLMTACQANLSPIFSIYADPKNEAQEILEAAIDDKTPLTVVDREGVKHELWLVSDLNAISRAAAIMGPKSLYVADGHHRYETSTNIRDAYRENNQTDAEHPTDYTLMTCVSMDDPGMIVLPTHRLFRGISETSSAQLIAAMGTCMETEVAGKGIERAAEIWERIEFEAEQGLMAFYCRADDTWVLARLTADGAQAIADALPEQSDEWRSLGVSILHHLVIEHLLGYKDLASPLYVRSLDRFETGLKEGDSAGRDATGQQGSGEPFNLGCLVMPASVEHVKAISENGERMPAKSTYFYPKMLSGLVFNTLDE